LSNTVVVITSDHGEEFFEHGWIGHSVSLFDESLRVPLVITGPGVPAGEVRSESAAMPLLPPLILSLAGVADPLHRDLAAIQATGAYGHTHAFGSPRYSLRTNDYRYLTPSEFTYGAYTKTYPPGLFRDRAEQQNLIAELPDVATQMQGALEKYVEEEIKHYGAMDPASLEIDTNRLQRLKELGYVN
jgi:arylsulfatase A-like enzyme